MAPGKVKVSATSSIVVPASQVGPFELLRAVAICGVYARLELWNWLNLWCTKFRMRVKSDAIELVVCSI